MDLTGFNRDQQKAITTTEGYVRVIAGAGTGKTKTLTSRYIYLVKEMGFQKIISFALPLQIKLLMK